jgi:hypothetical protein
MKGGEQMQQSRKKTLSIIAVFLGVFFCLWLAQTSIQAEETDSVQEVTSTVETSVQSTETDTVQEETSTTETSSQTEETDPVQEEAGTVEEDGTLVIDENNTDKSKTATDLDENKETEVTLEIPSGEMYRADVVLVMDKSAGSDIDNIEAQSKALLDSFMAKVETGNYSIKLGVVVFDGLAHDAYSLSQGLGDVVTGLVDVNADTYDSLLEAILYNFNVFNSYFVGGSNTETAVRLANRMLAADTQTPDQNKNLTLLSDLESYIYSGPITINGQTYEMVPVSKTDGQTTQAVLALDSSYDSWADLLSDWQSGAIQSRDDFNTNCFLRWGTFGYSWRHFWNNIYPGGMPAELAGITESDFQDLMDTEWAIIQTAGDNYVNGNDISLLMTYEALKESYERGYKIMVFSTSHDGTDGEDYNWNQYLKNKPMDFLEQIQNDFNAHIYGRTSTDSDIDNWGTTIGESFDDINYNIEYLFEEAELTDYIGDDFDLVETAGTCPFTLKIGSQTLTPISLGSDVWAFGSLIEKDGEQTYQYVLTYDRSEEMFVLQINVPVKVSDPLRLSYRLLLTADETGDYPTNKLASLKYTTEWNESFREYFEVPYVHYEKEVPQEEETTPSNDESESQPAEKAVQTAAVSQQKSGVQTSVNGFTAFWMIIALAAFGGIVCMKKER